MQCEAEWPGRNGRPSTVLDPLLFLLLSRLLTPLIRLIFLAGFLVQTHEPVQRLGPPHFPRRRNHCLAFLHAFISLPERWFGLGVFLLSEQGLAEHRLCGERCPAIRILLLADGQTFPKYGFGLG